MNAEHLLDAMGLLDDDLLREAEAYIRPKSRFHRGLWLSWAASFAVVLVLGYGLTHLGMGGGTSGGNATSFSGDAQSPMSPSDAETNQGSDLPAPGASDTYSGGNVTSPVERPETSIGGDAAEPITPETPGLGGCGPSSQEIFGMEGDQEPAIMVNGTLYWFLSAYTVMRPDERDIRYSTSYTDGVPEEDGQINFPKEGVRYFMMEDGAVALNWDGSNEWMVFAPDPSETP